MPKIVRQVVPASNSRVHYQNKITNFNKSFQLSLNLFLIYRFIWLSGIIYYNFNNNLQYGSI